MANPLNTITVDGVTYNAEAYAASNPTETKKNDDLGKDAFLQLLVTQLKNQDPLDPQDNSSYIAELAQFSSLEQMTNVVKNLEDLGKVVGNIDTSVLVGQLSSMIGKQVDWTETINEADAEGNPTSRETTLTGTVTGVTISKARRVSSWRRTAKSISSKLPTSVTSTTRRPKTRPRRLKTTLPTTWTLQPNSSKKRLKSSNKFHTAQVKSLVKAAGLFFN